MHICLGAAQICWLSDLMLFDFDLKYCVGKSNQAADALSRCPVNPDSSSESSDDEEEWETITYEMVCQILDYHLGSSKLPCHLKHEVQTNITDVERANKSLGLKSVKCGRHSTEASQDFQLNHAERNGRVAKERQSIVNSI